MPSVSRIPTRNNSNTKTALSTKTVNNENLPPASSTKLLQSKAPSSSKVGSTLSATTRVSRRIRESSVGQKAKAIEISVQLPSSEGGRGEGTDETNEGIERNPEYSEQEREVQGAQNVVEGDSQRSEAAVKAKNSLLPVPTQRTTQSRSRSKSPQIYPPSKPTYATLTSRRRSAAAALRRQSLSGTGNDDSPQPSTSQPSSSNPRRSSLRPKPRPSEILPVPIGPPQHPPELDNSEDGNDEEAIEDELMLLPPERGRGKGEGKEGMRKKIERERSVSRELGSRSRSRSVSVPTVAAEQEEEEPQEGEQYDWGGFEAEDAGYDFRDEERHEPVSEAAEENTVDPNESVEKVNFGSDEEEGDGHQEEQNDNGRNEEEDHRREESSDERQDDQQQRRDGQDEEEEDRKDFLPLHNQASSDTEPELPQDDEDLPFADQPRYSLSRSPSSASTQREQTPPQALQEGRSYSEIFPPLSPNTTGEHDEVEATRFESEPPPEIKIQEQSIEEEQVEEVEPEHQEEESEPTRLASPFLSRIEPPTEETKLVQTESAAPTLAREVTPLPPSYIQFEQEALSSVPAPSLLSPSSFLARTFSRTRSLTPVDPSPSRALPKINFVPLASPRTRTPLRFPSRSPSAVASTANVLATRSRQPSPLAGIGPTSAPPQQEWTRGPAFFRSSSFTPPPVRSSFDRKGKGKAADQDEADDDDESREYWKPGAMTGTSPHVSERGKTAEYEEEEEQEEEDEISLVRQPSSSPPVESRGDEQPLPPPTPSKDRPSPHDDPAHDSDASMRSPAASLRSRHSSVASPPRSPNGFQGGDFAMSSPVASIRSTRSFEMSLSPQSITSNKKLPATPPLATEADDQNMLSPSPARTQADTVVEVGGNRQLRRSPSKLEELVEAGKEKLTGLLSFGSPRFVQARSENVAIASSIDSAPQTSTSKVQLDESNVQGEDKVDHEDEDQPFPLSSTRHSNPSQQASNSNTTANESIFSNFSYANSTSRRNRRNRPSFSHSSSLPVIEISSTDAKAAARAAAILKVYHKYVEQGIEGSLARDEASRVIREAEKNGQQVDDAESDEEEELRTLLLDAEEEVRETFGRGLSVGSSERKSSTSRSPDAQTQTQPPARAEEEEDDDDDEEEVRSVLLSNHSRSPSVSQRVSDSPDAVQSNVQQPQPRSRTTSVLSSVVGEKWTSQEWRRLEQSLVELKRKTKGEGRDIEPREVVEAFLKKWGVQKEECQGDWEWDKLLIRVEAIKARRAKDVREHRAGSQASARSLSSSVRSENSSNVAEEGSSSGNTSTDREETASPARAIVKEEEEVESTFRRSDHGSHSDASDSEEEDEETRDDTFFASNRRLRRTRRTSMPHTRLPTALSNPRLAHIYDDAPAPEKPRLPMKEMLERGESVEPVESTPEPEAQREEPSKVAPPSSSAQRLFSYLGSFVRRSPAPSPTSSKFAPTSSVSPSPEAQAGEATEMSETRLRPSVVTPRLATDKSLPHLANRKIRPLPHPPHEDYSSSVSTSTPVASTSRSTLDVPTTELRGNRSIRRRRSSGEEGRVWEAVIAIEEAESSREEEEARIVEMLRSGSAKRKASGGDLRKKVQRGGQRG